jgi:hypothetical protein
MSENVILNDALAVIISPAAPFIFMSHVALRGAY